MSHKLPQTTRKRRKPYKGRTQKKVLAYDCCEHGHNGKGGKSKSWATTTTGRNLRTYVVRPDLYLEPTQRTLDLSTEEYVPFLDYNNNLLDEITSIINTSPTNRGIIMQKTTLSLGNGFYLKETKKRLSLEQQTILTEPQADALADYMDEVNPEGETLHELAYKVFFDWWTYGNAFVELIKLDVGGERRLIQRHIPLEMCRPKKAGKDRQIKYVGISDRWVENEIDPADVTDLPLYPTFEEVDDLEGERSVIHIKGYSPQFMYWGLPDWIAGMLWGELEYRIPKYNQSKFTNGYTPSAIVSFFGQMDPKEAQKLVDHFTDKFTNTGNNAKMFVQVLSDESMKADVQTLEDKSEGNFMELSQLARQNIVTAHCWTMSMAGMGTAGQLGSNQQIRSEFEILNKMVIEPSQHFILKKWIQPAIKEAAEWLGGGFENANLGIKTTIPISFLGDLKPEEVLTLNEQREVLGKEALDSAEMNGDILMTQTGNNERSTNTN